ncbi:MAG: hypothetical protein R3C49_28130 [Planctomycetaceae bacterium]
MTARRTTFLLTALLVLSATSARAQPVRYQFTATEGDANGRFENPRYLVGEVVLDPSAPPESGSQFSLDTIFTQGVSLNATLSTGLSGGTDSGIPADGTFYHDNRTPYFPPYLRTEHVFYRATYNNQATEPFISEMQVVAFHLDLDPNQPAAVPANWDVMGADFQAAVVTVTLPGGGTEYMTFLLDTFELAPTTVVVNSIDTGIEDRIPGDDAV